MELIIIVSTLIVIFLALWHLCTSRSKFATLVNKFPGPKGWPLIGNGFELLFIKHEDIVPLGIFYCKKYPLRIRAWLGNQPVLVLYNTNDVQTILSSSSVIDKASMYDFVHPWLGTGLLTSTGQKWRSRRKLLAPSFHFEILDNFISVFNEQSDTLIEILNENAKKSSFDIYPSITRCALDIICESVMGVKINAQINYELPYIKAVQRMKDIIHARMTKIYLWPDLVFNLLPIGRDHAKCLKILHELTENVIREKKASKEENFQNQTDNSDKKKRLAFLDLLLETSENGKILSDSDIQEEVDTFMFEGHDTTAVAMSWTIYLLGRNIHVQKKVQQELDSIFGDDKCRHVTMDDIKRMKYLELVIKESMRLFPPVPMLGREVKSDIVVDGKTVPPGVIILISPLLLHRNPIVFPDPETFNPDRFLPENSLNRNPFSYVPFSAGLRNCIGQKFAMLDLKVILSRVFRSFNIEALEPLDKLKLTIEIVILSKNGIKVKLTPRK